MTRDIERWFVAQGEELMKRVGIRPGDLVLDFGCGSGCYTIPAANPAGQGCIYNFRRIS